MRIPFTGNSRSGDVTFPDAPNVPLPTGYDMEETIKKIWDIWANAIDNIANAMNGSQNITYYDAPMEQPFFHVRSVDSKVSVYPGATIVMGGLITEARKAMDDKIPFLGDIPFIGRLFRSHSEQTSKRNLLIFVTTRLVDVRGREISLSALEQKDSEVKAAPAEQD
jgi:type II secretory pathway component GspD/PulD (secretin)